MLTTYKTLYNQRLTKFVHISTGIHKERKKEAKKERKATILLFINHVLILIKSGLDNGVHLITMSQLLEKFIPNIHTFQSATNIGVIFQGASIGIAHFSKSHIYTDR